MVDLMKRQWFTQAAPCVVHAMIFLLKRCTVTWNPFFLKQSKLEGRYEQNKGHWTRLEKFAHEFQRLQEVLHVFDLLIVTDS